MYKRGIDVSHWEPDVRFGEVKAAGYEFMFTKASQGSVEDPLFKTHWNNARGILPRGAYHFYDPRYASVTPEVQAEKFWGLLEPDQGEMPLTVDIELYTTGPYHGADYWYRFIDRLHRISGQWPLVYTAYYYWVDNVKVAPVQDVTWFSEHCDLWVANYGVLIPQVPPPWTDWTCWQYSETGMVPGVYDELGRLTECDLDYFKGEMIPVEVPMDVYFTASAVSNIRSAPTLVNSDLGSFNLLVGDIFQVDPLETKQAEGYTWLRLTALWRGGTEVPLVLSPSGAYWVARTAYITPASYTPPTVNEYILYVRDGVTRKFVPEA
jgi:lysozyme